MSKLQKRKESGFTIIEVLIVLAIAGLIMLIVFLAVPALQRNSRNTQRKNDVSRVGTAANEYVSNNNGTLPTSSNGAAASIASSAGTLGQYQASDISVSATTGAQNAITNSSNVVIVTGAKCGASGATVAGQSRSMAIQYMVENAGGFTAVCTDI